MKNQTQKELFLVSGMQCRQLGNGGRRVVVLTEMPVDTEDKDFRSKHGFRPNNLESGRFFWKGNVTVTPFNAELVHTMREEAEMANCFAIKSHTFMAARASNIDDLDELERMAVAQWVLDHQRELNDVALAVDEVLNITQHKATDEQLAGGVVEPENKAEVQATLTFDTLPSKEEVAHRAEILAKVARESGCKKAMIGGAPFFMSALENALVKVGVQPVYAFSVRDSKEEPDGNGGVRKVNVFRHVGFVEVN
jgi:hypothetical protein